jgi:hypothetical protein
MSFSAISDADPRSQTFKTVFCSFTLEKYSSRQTLRSKRQPTYQDIIRFDVSMHNIALPEQRQSEEQLIRIRSYSSNVKPDVLSKSFDDFTEVHAV